MGFCVKCGKKDIKGSLCPECSKEENPILKEFKDITINICRNCNAYKEQGRWYDARSAEEGIEKIAEDSIKRAGITLKPKIRIILTKPAEELKKERGTKHIKVEASFPGEEYVLPVDIVFGECLRCSKQRSLYFEAILQLRNPRPEIIDFIKRRIESKNKVGIFLTDMKEVPNGIDFYLTNRKYAMHLGKLLQKKFFGIFKTSAKLFTKDRNTQKDIYRVNVLFKAIGLQPGDIIKSGEEEIKIMGVRGERIQGISLKNRKRVFVDIHELEKQK